MPNMINLRGKKFNRLLVISESSKRDNSGTTQWNCRCECGSELTVRGINLRNGNTKSCGCYNREMKAAICRSRTQHGLTGTPTYQTWQNMLRRCNVPRSDKYPIYGGRGIKVCEQWHKFSNFLRDMGEKPIKMTIDRINNNGNYEKSNCRWASSRDQSNNTRRNHIIEYNGQRKTLEEWSRFLKIPRNTIKNRINLLGWPIGKALTTPRQNTYRR